MSNILKIAERFEKILTKVGKGTKYDRADALSQKPISVQVWAACKSYLDQVPEPAKDHIYETLLQVRDRGDKSFDDPKMREWFMNQVKTYAPSFVNGFTEILARLN